MKIGDKVKILPDNNKNYPFSYADEMKNYVGKIMTIKKIIYKSYSPSDYSDFPDADGNRYYMVEDDEQWQWSNPMFKLVNTLQVKKKKVKLNYEL